jgi:hypothetical protein
MKINKTAGFTLFIALVIASTLLLVSVGIVNLAVRGALISSIAKESQNAFYAADTGVECALYWDVKNPGRNASAFVPASVQNINCNGTTLVHGSTLIRTRLGNNATSTFSINFANFSETYCATVSVAKVQTGAVVVTKIESKGYNKSCTTSDPRRVERAVRVTY